MKKINIMIVMFVFCFASFTWAQNEEAPKTVTTSDYTINIGGDGTVIFDSDGNTIGPSDTEDEEMKTACDCNCDSRQNVRGGFFGYGYETVIWVINPEEEYEFGMLQISNTRYPVNVAPLSQGFFALSEFMDEPGACSIMLESEALILDIEREKIE